MARPKGSKNKPKATIGHNSNLTEHERAKLQGYVAEIEDLEATKATIAEGMKEIYGAAKEAGFDTKAIRAVIKRRKADQEKLLEYEDRVDAYESACWSDTPLAQAAVQREREAVFKAPDTSDRPFA